MKKMEIEKTNLKLLDFGLHFSNQQYTGTVVTQLNPKSVIGTTKDAEFLDIRVDHVDGTKVCLAQDDKRCYLTLTPQDILKLMTWLVGQEKHRLEIQDSKNSSALEDFFIKKWGEPPLKESRIDYFERLIDEGIRNQKIVDELIQACNEPIKGSLVEDILPKIIKRATGKDIKDL